jgi:hypothetical protein
MGRLSGARHPALMCTHTIHAPQKAWRAPVHYAVVHVASITATAEPPRAATR